MNNKNTLPSEPIGSIPRPKELVEGLSQFEKGKITGEQLETLLDKAVRETVKQFEAAGSEVVTDGEQRKPSFATYPIHGLKNLNPNGVTIPFKDGHTRQLPTITSGPFEYKTYAAEYLTKLKKITKKTCKQAVISPSALSLLYPADGIKNYPKEEFITDLIHCAVRDIRQCLDQGAIVQIDITEARLAVKLDPSKGLLKAFIDLNNQVLSHFNEKDRTRIGVHTCPGGDKDSTHSADIPYSSFLPEFFQLNVGNFYLQYSSEKDRKAVLKTIKPFATAKRRIFLGVTDPISPKIETPEQICQTILEAADVIPLEHLGTTDDCGFAPFCDDFSTSRELAFTKIKNRIQGTALAIQTLSGHSRKKAA